jgi:hypothetical protein
MWQRTFSCRLDLSHLEIEQDCLKLVCCNFLLWLGFDHFGISVMVVSWKLFFVDFCAERSIEDAGRFRHRRIVLNQELLDDYYGQLTLQTRLSCLEIVDFHIKYYFVVKVGLQLRHNF